MTADELLARFAKTRDQGAYEELYQLVHPDILRSLLGFTISLGEETTRDIVQEVFVKLQREPEKFWRSEGGAARPMMVVAARNLALDALRKKARQKEISYDAMREQGIEPRLEPSTVPDSGTDLPGLEEMLKVLDEGATKSEQALLRELVASEHWTTGKLDPKSLAERQGTTVSNIYKRMERVRGRAQRTYGSISGFLATVAAAAWNWLKAAARRPEVLYPALAALGLLLALLVLRPGRQAKRGLPEIPADRVEAVSPAQTQNGGAPATPPSAAVVQDAGPVQTNSLIGAGRIVPSFLVGMDGFTIQYHDPLYPVAGYIDFIEPTDDELRAIITSGTASTNVAVSLQLSDSPTESWKAKLCSDFRLFKGFHELLGVEASDPGTRRWTQELLRPNAMFQPSAERLAMPTAGENWTHWIQAMEERHRGQGVEEVELRRDEKGRLQVPSGEVAWQLGFARSALLTLAEVQTAIILGDSSGPFGRVFMCELKGPANNPLRVLYLQGPSRTAVYMPDVHIIVFPRDVGYVGSGRGVKSDASYGGFKGNSPNSGGTSNTTKGTFGPSFSTDLNQDIYPNGVGASGASNGARATLPKPVGSSGPESPLPTGSSILPRAVGSNWPELPPPATGGAETSGAVTPPLAPPTTGGDDVSGAVRGRTYKAVAAVSVRATPSVSGKVLGTQPAGGYCICPADSPATYAEGSYWLMATFPSGASGWVPKTSLEGQ